MRAFLWLARQVRGQEIGALVNLLGLSLAAACRAARVPFFPMMLFVEITTRCNLNCLMCPRTFAPRPERDMPYREFERILSQFPHLAWVVPQGIGEPLFHPDLNRIIRYSVGRGAKVTFNTNATILTVNAARMLVNSGLQELSFSIDSADETLYCHIRPGASLMRVVDNIRRMIRIRDELGSLLPHLVVRVVAMKENLSHIPAVIDLALSLGITDIAVQDLVLPDPTLTSSRIDEVGYHILLDYVKAAMAQGIRIKLDNFARFLPWRGASCRSPWLSPYITVNGYVTPCCIISDPRQLNFGNIHKTTFWEIWNGPAFQQFRADFRRGHVPEICITCPSY